MKKILSLAPLLLLTGCTFFNVNELADNTYRISGHASVFKSKQAIVKNITNKARKVCGNDNFDFIDKATGQINPNYTNHYAGTSQTLVMTVRCN